MDKPIHIVEITISIVTDKKWDRRSASNMLQDLLVECQTDLFQADIDGEYSAIKVKEYKITKQKASTILGINVRHLFRKYVRFIKC